MLIAIGGAAGGIFVNIVAPSIFNQYLEMFIGFVTCCVLLIGLTIYLRRETHIWKTAILVAVQASILIGIVIIGLRDYRSTVRGAVWMDRNFFGVLRIKEKTIEPEGYLAYQLVHGITIHGLQFFDEDVRNLPTTYYTESSGVGLAYKYSQNEESKKVGVLGLGVGTIASYGHKTDTIRFYEINPSVIDLATGLGNYFDYLPNSKALIEIVPGDARLSLAHEYDQSGSQQYDLLVLDTFSSDSIPVHLLTYEAFDLYLKHLKVDGVLAVHISNIHLDLEPVVREIAKAHQLNSVLVTSGKIKPGSSASVWILTTRDQTFFDKSEIQPFVKKLSEEKMKVKLWTDDYSNLFQIIR